jgi:ParB-like chromosome segregation protein Spo0J
MKVIDVPLDQINIGERRRQDYGDIGALAKGIQRVGLLEPIIVDRNSAKDQYRLVAGARRIRAVLMLKWKVIPAQLKEHLTDAQLRDIELEENENRKSLTERERTRTFASSKKLIGSAVRAGQILSSAAEDKPKPRGHQPKYGVKAEEVAEAIGSSETSLIRAEQHIETAERFPFMQARTWRQSDVLRIREGLEELPAEEREAAAGVLRCAKLLDPETAVELVDNLTAKKPDERQVIYDLAQSDDPRKQSLALTEAAKLPPMPDPRIGILDNALHILNAAIKPYPKDPLTPQLIEIRASLQKVRAAVKEVSYDARRQKGTTLQ